MPARILVVDDVVANRKLMSVRLEGAYYTPLTAACGEDAISILKEEDVDLVLLDVMMPGIDGYETCRRIKADPRTRDIPVVLITSLDQPEDRRRGSEAGADDFLTKPAADLPLFSRLRSLTRMKVASDDLRAKLGPLVPPGPLVGEATSSPHVLVVQDGSDRNQLQRSLSQGFATRVALDLPSAIDGAADGAELVLVDLTARGFDPLAACSGLRSSTRTRHLPILAAGREEDPALIWRALDLGVDDYVPLPLDRIELLTRVGTHIRRRREDAALTSVVQQAAGMVYIDPLTGLGNRRLLENRLEEFVGAAGRGHRPFSVLLIDLDHFKRINDRYGHPAGDAVLQEFARRLGASVRSNDVACRFGGEEFVVLLDGIEEGAAFTAAERLLSSTRELELRAGGAEIGVTVSIGVAEWRPRDDSVSLLSRADHALYEAKRSGRDRVVSASQTASILNHS